jgi:hypothetical protein
MRAAACTAHLGAYHIVRVVLDKFDGVRRDHLREARLAGARVILCSAVEECVAAGGTMVEADIVGVYELACGRLEPPTAVPDTGNEIERGHGRAYLISSTRNR